MSSDGVQRLLGCAYRQRTGSCSCWNPPIGCKQDVGGMGVLGAHEADASAPRRGPAPTLEGMGARASRHDESPDYNRGGISHTENYGSARRERAAAGGGRAGGGGGEGGGHSARYSPVGTWGGGAPTGRGVAVGRQWGGATGKPWKPEVETPTVLAPPLPLEGAIPVRKPGKVAFDFPSVILVCETAADVDAAASRGVAAVDCRGVAEAEEAAGRHASSFQVVATLVTTAAGSDAALGRLGEGHEGRTVVLYLSAFPAVDPTSLAAKFDTLAQAHGPRSRTALGVDCNAPGTDIGFCQLLRDAILETEHGAAHLSFMVCAFNPVSGKAQRAHIGICRRKAITVVTSEPFMGPPLPAAVTDVDGEANAEKTLLRWSIGRGVPAMVHASKVDFAAAGAAALGENLTREQRTAIDLLSM